MWSLIPYHFGGREKQGAKRMEVFENRGIPLHIGNNRRSETPRCLTTARIVNLNWADQMNPCSPCTTACSGYARHWIPMVALLSETEQIAVILRSPGRSRWVSFSAKHYVNPGRLAQIIVSWRLHGYCFADLVWVMCSRNIQRSWRNFEPGDWDQGLWVSEETEAARFLSE